MTTILKHGINRKLKLTILKYEPNCMRPIKPIKILEAKGMRSIKLIKILKNYQLKQDQSKLESRKKKLNMNISTQNEIN